MARKGKSTEEIIGFLREAEVRIAQGETAGKICRGAGISEQTYYIYGRLSRCKRIDRGSGALGCQHRSGVTGDAGAPKWVARGSGASTNGRFRRAVIIVR